MRTKIIISLALTIIASSSWGNSRSCLERLTKNAKYDSYHYTVSTEDVFDEIDYGTDHIAQSIVAIKIVLDRVKCNPRDIDFSKNSDGYAKSRCRYIIPNKSYSEVCIVESNIGYFVVNSDFQDTTHLVFNRWD